MNSTIGVRRSVALLSLIFVVVSQFLPIAVTASTASDITKRYQQQAFTNFDHFLLSLAQDGTQADWHPAIKQFRSNKPLLEAQRHQIYRLLGVYTRIKYGAQAIETLRELVSIPTFRESAIPPHQNPHILQIGQAIQRQAEAFGLQFYNADNRVFVVSLNKPKGKTIGLHAHADVVPVNRDAWVLADGTRLEPFQLTRIGNRLYGRGAEDDKNGIVVTLYAMKVIQEEQLPLLHHFQLLVDTTEESGADAIRYYLEHHPTPDYNIALDGGYPVVIAEKGYGTLMANFPIRLGTGQGAELAGLTGGLATNQIPALATAQFISDAPQSLKAQLDRLARPFIEAHGNNFSIATQIQDHGLQLTVTGESAHSSSPSSGINPVSRLLLFLHQAQQQIPLKTNHFTDAAQYAAENWGLDYHGKVLGIGFEHEFMGPLTAALTYIGLDQGQLQLAVNLRMPQGKSAAQLKAELQTRLHAWQQKRGIRVRFEHQQRAPMYRNPNGKWVNALLDVASQNLGIPRQFRSSNGTTSIHNLPNGVQFGLSMPGTKYTGHNANEFKTVDQFLLDLQIVTEMMARLGSLPSLQ